MDKGFIQLHVGPSKITTTYLRISTLTEQTTVLQILLIIIVELSWLIVIKKGEAIKCTILLCCSKSKDSKKPFHIKLKKISPIVIVAMVVRELASFMAAPSNGKESRRLGFGISPGKSITVQLFSSSEYI